MEQRGDNNLIHGDDGNDRIIGGQRRDTIYGSAGNDTLTGGADDDTLYGGDGEGIFSIGDDHVGDVRFGGEGSSDWDNLSLYEYLYTTGVAPAWPDDWPGSSGARDTTGPNNAGARASPKGKRTSAMSNRW